LVGTGIEHKEGAPVENQPSAQNLSLPFKEYRAQLLENGEHRYFSHVVSQAGGNLQKACRLSGLSKSRLYHFLKKYDISLAEGSR
jgi:two-component system, NtrC family, response regulator